MPSHSAFPRSRVTRQGLTLLEVLIACGILVIGLASVAALLPAAASVLTEATSFDRAGALAANAFAELQTPGVLRADWFAEDVQDVAIGDVFSPPLKKVFDPPGGVDNAAYGSASYAGVLGRIDSSQEPLEAGTLARLAIVVFKKAAPEVSKVRLLPFPRRDPGDTSEPTGIYELVGFGPNTDAVPSSRPAHELEPQRKRFLPSCSWTLGEADGRAVWLHVTGSWATSKPREKQPDRCFVAFTDPEAAAAAESSCTDDPAAKELVLRVFNGILRRDERFVILH